MLSVSEFLVCAAGLRDFPAGERVPLVVPLIHQIPIPKVRQIVLGFAVVLEIVRTVRHLTRRA